MAHSDHSEFREEFDAEHPHEYDHSEPKYSIISILGVVTVVLLLIVGIGIQEYYNHTEESLVYNKVLTQPNWILQDLRNKENWELTHYQYVDKQKGTVRVPIDQAMKLLVDEAASNKEKYPTNAYAVKSPDQLAASGQVSQPGAALAEANQSQGTKSSPDVQPSTTPQQPHK